MKPRYVTLTGADDTVSPNDLFAISKEFPFVEWGILTGSQMGHRFPSEYWINALLGLSLGPINLSLHICGAPLRSIAGGKLMRKRFSFGAFQRCQLNWHGEYQGDIADNIVSVFDAYTKWHPEVIFQLDGQNADLAFAARHHIDTAGLFDCSHGAGVLPQVWPNYYDAFPCGYAGGLGPDNIAEELPKIQAVAGDGYWIDMETKLYTGFQFDLDKCRSVLEAVKP